MLDPTGEVACEVKPPSTDDYCTNFFKHHPDKGGGQVVCCGGKPVPCANRAGLSKPENYGPAGPAVDAIVRCVKAHEQKHIDDHKRDCKGVEEGDSAGSGAENAHQDECKGYTAEVDCWSQIAADPCPPNDAGCAAAVAKHKLLER